MWGGFQPYNIDGIKYVTGISQHMYMTAAPLNESRFNWELTGTCLLGAWPCINDSPDVAQLSQHNLEMQKTKKMATIPPASTAKMILGELQSLNLLEHCLRFSCL